VRVLLDINETKYIILNVLIDYMRFKQSKKCTNLLLIKWFAIVQVFNIKLQFYALASINFRQNKYAGVYLIALCESLCIVCRA
jgi:hypothetical protein